MDTITQALSQTKTDEVIESAIFYFTQDPGRDIDALQSALIYYIKQAGELSQEELNSYLDTLSICLTAGTFKAEKSADNMQQLAEKLQAIEAPEAVIDLLTDFVLTSNDANGSGFTNDEISSIQSLIYGFRDLRKLKATA